MTKFCLVKLLYDSNHAEIQFYVIWQKLQVENKQPLSQLSN